MVASLVYLKIITFITLRMKGVHQFVSIIGDKSLISQPERRIVHHCLFYHVNAYNFLSLLIRVDSYRNIHTPPKYPTHFI